MWSTGCAGSSGAGPSIALLARRDTARVERLVSAIYEQAGVEAAVRTLVVHEALENTDEVHMADAAASAPGGNAGRSAAEAFRETETGRTL